MRRRSSFAGPWTRGAARAAGVLVAAALCGTGSAEESAAREARPAPAALTAGVLVVNDAGDAGPGNCDATCTLRDAVGYVASGGTIAFSATLLPASITLTQGELVIAKSLTIQGPGAGRLAIGANDAGRVIDVVSGSVAIGDVTLRDGNVIGAKGFTPSPGSATGGGQGDAASGGCVAIAAGASLILTRTDVRNCAVRGGAGGDGASGPDNSSTLNGAGIDGGAGGPGGSGSGGGIYVAGSLTLLDSSVTASAAYGGAGGRGGDGGLGGLAVPNGSGGNGGIGADGRGAAVHVAPGGSVWLENATLATSHADGGAGGQGGTATSSSSSVHGGNGGPGGNGRAGLLYIDGSVALADVEFSTLADGAANGGGGGPLGLGLNGAAPGGAGSAGAGLGAALAAFSGIDALSSVVVGSAAVPLCQPASFVLGAGVVNLDQDSSCTGFTLHGTRAQSFRALDASAALPALMPAYGSAVIDASPGCSDLSNAAVPVDEHGTPRPQGAQCDLGAIEADYIFVGTFN